MNLLKQMLKFFVVTKYLVKQYFSIICNALESKDFFTQIYVQAIQNRNNSKMFSRGIHGLKLEEIFPGIEKTNILIYAHYESLFKGFYNREAGFLVSARELFVLTSLVKFLKPKKLFEFGTFKGWTLANLVQNLEQGTEIHTLDIFKVEPEDQRINEVLKNGNVNSLIGDSRIFDFSPYYKKMDFIFVDGDHSEEMVRKDTESALKMIADNGVIVWHDFNEDHPGVQKFLHEQRFELPIYFIKGTSMVIYQNTIPK